MLVTKQLTAAIDFHSMGKIPWKSMATISCSVTNILQNIFFCVQQKKGLEKVQGEKMTEFSFLGELSL